MDADEDTEQNQQLIRQFAAAQQITEQQAEARQERTEESVNDEVYTYILNSIRAGYRQDIISSKLAEAGHDPENIRKMMQKALNGQIREIDDTEKLKQGKGTKDDLELMKEPLLTKFQYETVGFIVSTIVKIFIFVVFVYTMSHVLLSKIYLG